MATKRKGKSVQAQMEDLEAKKEFAPKTFNFADYQIAKEPRTEVVVIEATGDEFEVKIQDLSWSRRNQILSRSLKWGEGGQTSFDGDAYVRNCLKEMIKEAPWGATSESFLLTIDERLGNALEGIVPNAFGDQNNTEIGLEDTDPLKKE